MMTTLPEKNEHDGCAARLGSMTNAAKLPRNKMAKPNILVIFCVLPVVPHKAAAEVSE